MEKKYKVLNQYDFDDEDYNHVHSTKEEAIAEATKQLQEHPHSKVRYVAQVITEVKPVAQKIIEVEVKEL